MKESELNRVIKKVHVLRDGRQFAMVMTHNIKRQAEMEDIAEADLAIPLRFTQTIHGDTEKPWYGVEFQIPLTVTIPLDYKVYKS